MQTEESLPDSHSFQDQKNLSPHLHNNAREVGEEEMGNSLS